MAEFPYCTNASSVRRCFEAIQGAAVPQRMSSKFLEGFNFHGSDLRSLAHILKTLGFVSLSEAPTKRWQSYRNKAVATQVMAQAVREVYADLFEAYPDAHHKEDEELKSIFHSQSKMAPSTVGYMIRTFRTLCKLADFDRAPLSGTAAAATPPNATPVPPPADGADPPGRGVAVNLTVQLQLPVTDDPAVYDALFAALRRNLLE